MRLCIVGPKGSHEVEMLKKAAQKREIDVKRVDLVDIYFEASPAGTSVSHRKIELLDYDIFIFRTPNKISLNAYILANYLQNKGKKVIDQCMHKSIQSPEISAYLLAQKGIPMLDTYFTTGIKSARDVLMDIDHPITAKYESKNGTEIVYSEDWTESYDLVRTNKNKEFTFRSCLDSDSYYKVYVIGDKVVGALKKVIQENTYELNYSKNVKSKFVEISSEMADLALKACKALDIDIASVDIVENDQELLVLDVHRSPKFGKFQRISGVNFSNEILDYLNQL